MSLSSISTRYYFISCEIYITEKFSKTFACFLSKLLYNDCDLSCTLPYYFSSLLRKYITLENLFAHLNLVLEEDVCKEILYKTVDFLM